VSAVAWQCNCDFTIHGRSEEEVNEKLRRLTDAARQIGIDPPHTDHSGAMDADRACALGYPLPSKGME